MALHTHRLLDSEEAEQYLHSQALELAFERSQKHFNLNCGVEESRRFQVKILLAENANEELREQLVKDDDRIDELETTLRSIWSDLEGKNHDTEEMRGELLLKNRELENLKAKLRSMQGLSIEHTAILGDKLALSHEVANLKTEMDHLRAQITSNQNLLADKLSLQRELSTVQVELETERRAMQRMTLREDGRQVHDADQELQVQQLQADLNVERRERQKAERELQKLMSDLETKKAVHEARVEAFRNKLRITKDQLKETQFELRNSRPPVYTSNALDDVNSEAGAVSRKRSIAQVETDATIGTPGNPPAAKKAKRGSALPGTKSTFSITPYLNRTASVFPESLHGSQMARVAEGAHDQEDDEKEGEEEEEESRREEVDIVGRIEREISVCKPSESSNKDASSTNPRSKPSKASVSAPNKDINTKALNQRKGRNAPVLDQVKEHEVENHTTVSFKGLENKTSVEECSHTPSENSKSREPNPAKRKRRLLGGGLGKTLFDEDDIDSSKGRERVNHTGKFLPGTSRFDLNFGKAKLGRSTSMSGSTRFSPLKKDRRPL